MIKVAFFDVCETWIRGGKPLYGVIEAIQSISQLKTATGQPLSLGIISNYCMPSPPVTEEKILALETQYQTNVLEPTGLAKLFDPFETKVSISSRVGKTLPDRGIFDFALFRMHSSATIHECSFITDEALHLAQCKSYGMFPIRFGSKMPGLRCFSNWCDAPLLLSSLISPDDMQNISIAMAPALATHHGLNAFTITDVHGRVIQGRAKQLFQLLDPILGGLAGIYVERSTEVTVEINAVGNLANVQAGEPGPEEVSDAVNFVRTLILGGRIAQHGEIKGTTHTIQMDGSGRDVLVRQRYAV